ncbi:MAG: cytochrome P460 family protein [Planctomycetota bacterium]|jgi:hypothetical protein
MSKVMYAGVFVAALGLLTFTGCKGKQTQPEGCGGGCAAACSAGCGAGCAGCGCTAGGCGEGGCGAACGCGAEACGCGGCGDACGGCAGGCGGCGCGAGGAVDANDAKQAALLFGQYRKWSRANNTAFTSKPHGRHKVYDYVNSAARKTFTDGKGAYKPGSVVVKEGWKQGKRSMVWIMEKRPAGYNADNGDWFYATMKADGSVVEAGPIESCIACHANAENDYVFGVPE